MGIIQRFATEDYVDSKIPEMQLATEYAIPEKFMGKQVYQVYFRVDEFPKQGEIGYIESDIFSNIKEVLELTATVHKDGLLFGTFQYGSKALSLGYDKQQYNGATIKIFINNEMDSSYFDANTTALVKMKYTKVDDIA